jgi:sugar O-acyltransferase (sialic acid O-acetyltransferase NeuD family)
LTRKKILIAGSSGFAFECYQMILDIMAKDRSLTFKGFLAPDNQLERYGLEKLYLGDEKNHEFSPEERVIIGLGTPQLRKRIYEALERRRVNMDNLISSYALVNAGAEMGRGNVVAPFCIIPSGAKIGNGNVFNSYTSLGHDSKVGHFNVLSSYCNLTGFTVLQDLNFLGPGVKMLPKSKIGNNCRVAAGSIIYKGFKDNAIILGNPAYKIGNTRDRP